MADPRRAIIVAGNYRCGTTWLAEMLTRGLPGKHALLFEPIRAYYKTMKDAGVTQWRPYITEENATPAQVDAFRKVFTGEMAEHERDIAHTDQAAVLTADALVVKMVRGLMSLNWMIDTFEPRHTFVIIRHPVGAIASQLRVGAVPGTPKYRSELDAFFEHHPEIPRFTPKTDVEWLATYWAAGYYAALQQLPRTGFSWDLIRYETLLPTPRGYLAGIEVLFDLLREEPVVPAEELAYQPSAQTKRPLARGDCWTPLPARLSLRQLGDDSLAVWAVVERFPGLAELYDEP